MVPPFGSRLTPFPRRGIPFPTFLEGEMVVTISACQALSFAWGSAHMRSKWREATGVRPLERIPRPTFRIGKSRDSFGVGKVLTEAVAALISSGEAHTQHSL